MTLSTYYRPEETVLVFRLRVLEILNKFAALEEIAHETGVSFTLSMFELRFPEDVPLSEDSRTLDSYDLKGGFNSNGTCPCVVLLHRDSNGDLEPIDLHEGDVVVHSKEEIDEILKHYEAVADV